MLPISIRPPPLERKEVLKTQELDAKPYSSSTFSEPQDHPHPPPPTFPSATSKTPLSQPLLLLPLFEAALLTNIATILILAVVYAHQLLRAQAWSESEYSSTNRAQAQTHNNALRWTLLSTAVTPVLSIFAALTGHVVWCRQRRRRKGVSAACSAIVTASFLVGWLVNVASWAVCDWEPSSSVCFQAGLGRDSQGKVVGVNPGLVRTRIVLGSLMVVGYALCFSTLVVRMRRRYTGGALEGE